MAADLRSTLRALPVLTGHAPEFDPSQSPDDPVTLFVSWFGTALQAGVPEPHAMTLSTIDRDGLPDARVLILKDVDARGWHFAISAESKKGADLSSNPVAALTFYWPQLVRQIRVSGAVVADPPDVAAADFLARSRDARALVLTRRQSHPLGSPTELDDALAEAHAAIEAEPDVVPAEWTSYAVAPERVEFWQGDPARRHRRLRYTRAPGGVWAKQTLWP